MAHEFIARKGLIALDDSQITGSLDISTSLTASGLKYPSTDGTSGQVLTTDGSGNLTFTNTTTAITASAISASYIDLDPIPDGAEPDWKEGRIFYSAEDGALSVYNSEADITLQVGQEFWKRAKNGTSNTILNGTPVRISGSSGEKPLIFPALAEDHSQITSYDNHIVGVATHDIGGNSVGFITEKGNVNDIDTSAFNEGDTLYLQTSSVGFRNTPPPFPYDIVQVGTVIRSHASVGSIEVDPREPVHFGNISGLSGSVSGPGDLWVYQSNGAWTPSKTLSGSYTINNGDLNIDGILSIPGFPDVSASLADTSDLDSLRNSAARITYIYTSSNSTESSVPDGQIMYVNDVVDYILINTSSYNGVNLDESSQSTPFGGFLFNEIGSMITARSIETGAFKTYKVLDVTYGTDVVRYDIQSLGLGVTSGSLIDGEEVEFVWDKSAGVGSISGISPAFQSVIGPAGYNWIEIFKGDYTGNPLASYVAADNFTAELTGSIAMVAALTESADLTVNSVTANDFTGDLTGNADTATTASYALTASYVAGGGGGGVTINNNIDNYIVTATGTANTLNGEVNFTINSGEFNVGQNGYITYTPGAAGRKSGVYYDVDGNWEDVSTTFAGTTLKVGTAISTTAGKLYHLSGSWNEADASFAEKATGFLGVALDTGTTNTFLKEGVYSLLSTQVGGSYVAGAPLYVSETAGAVTFTPPTTTGAVVRIIGHALDSYTSGTTYYKIYFNPSHNWIEL